MARSSHDLDAASDEDSDEEEWVVEEVLTGMMEAKDDAIEEVPLEAVGSGPDEALLDGRAPERASGPVSSATVGGPEAERDVDVHVWLVRSGQGMALEVCLAAVKGAKEEAYSPPSVRARPGSGEAVAAEAIVYDPPLEVSRLTGQSGSISLYAVVPEGSRPVRGPVSEGRWVVAEAAERLAGAESFAGAAAEKQRKGVFHITAHQ